MIYAFCYTLIMNYYDETIEKINKLLIENKQEEIKSIIEDELKAPYLPNDFEKQIKDIYSKLNISKVSNKQLSYDEINEYLFSTPEKQLIAVEQLNNFNLRDYIDLVNKYLTSNGYINAKALLIDSLVNQEISDEVKYSNNGIDYTFIPKFIIPIEKSDGFLSAIKYLENFYMKDPSKLLMSKDLVYKETLLSLPINLEEEEGIILAKKAIDYIEEAFK